VSDELNDLVIGFYDGEGGAIPLLPTMLDEPARTWLAIGRKASEAKDDLSLVAGAIKCQLDIHNALQVAYAAGLASRPTGYRLELIEDADRRGYWAIWLMHGQEKEAIMGDAGEIESPLAEIQDRLAPLVRDLNAQVIVLPLKETQE